MFRISLLLVLSLSATLASAADNKIVKMIKFGNRAAVAKPLAPGKRQLYALFSYNNSGLYLLPSAQISCDGAMGSLLEATEFSKLQELGEQGHIAGFAVQPAVHWDDATSHFSDCDENSRKQILVNLFMVAEGLDETGNQFLAEYTATMSHKKFFNYPIHWQKPRQIVNEYKFELWRQIKNQSPQTTKDIPTIRFYETFHESHFGENLVLTEFLDVANQNKNTSALMDFFKTKGADSALVDEVIESYKQLHKSVKLTLELSPIYIFDNWNNDRAIIQNYFTERIDYNCPGLGQCLR